MVEIRVLTATRGELLAAVRRLLDAAFAGDFSEDDWCHALGGYHVVALHDRQPVAHAAVVPRELEFGDRATTGERQPGATGSGRTGAGPV